MGIFEVIKKIPLVGIVATIANAYVYGGDAKGLKRFAPLRLWFKAFWAELLVTWGLTVLSTGCCLRSYLPVTPSCDVVKGSGDLIITVFPSLIGFGIGVYALIFALSKSVIAELQKTIEERRQKDPNLTGSVLAINAEFAYPLLVLALATCIGVLAKLYPDSAKLIFLSWAAFWYGSIMVIELIHSLFLLGEAELLDRL